MKRLLLVLIAVIFLKRGVPVPERVEVILRRSNETVLMFWTYPNWHEYLDVGAGTYTFYPDGRIESALTCEVN